MRTMLFNPYTGRPRDPRDIASDPAGVLMVDPDEPLKAAPQAQLAEPTMVAIAKRNLRAFLSKASFASNVDREAALNCVEVLEQATGRQIP